jgi:glycosyltransferase involved in cell wall biosynthesis
MKILMVTNYYYPYISGLSEVVRQISEELIRQGHTVVVLCSNHNKLQEKETINGVKVLRAPIIAKISKGTVSIKFISWAKKLSQKADVVNIHMPMLESGIIISIIGGHKCLATYQCDIDLKKGIINSFIKATMLRMNDWGLKNASKILVTSIDYGKHSKLAGKYPDKLIEVRTPIKDYYPAVVNKDHSKKTIGFCGRIVMEKGIDILIKAYAIIKSKMPEAELLIGGDYNNIAGGSIYTELKEYVTSNSIMDVHFLGAIPESDMEKFYSSLDVFVLPSVNPLEAFGMVQVEAMYCGTPVVASDLYGVRTIVHNTGMGLIAKAGSPEDFAAKIIEVLADRDKFVKPRENISDQYSTKRSAEAYLNAFNSIQ